MKIALLGIVLCSFFISSCKKKENEPEPEFDGSAPGKIKSINNGYWSFKYTEDGLLSEYKYTNVGFTNTATLTWDASQVNCVDGIAYSFLRPRDNAGYALPGNGDIQAGNNWTYDADHKVIFLKGTNYFWSNGNIDSLTLGGAVTIFEYSNFLDNRDYGAKFVPLLSNFPVYNIPVKNLKTKYVQLNLERDTVSIRTFYYTFDASGRVSNETVYELISGSEQYVSQLNYEYY